MMEQTDAAFAAVGPGTADVLKQTGSKREGKRQQAGKKPRVWGMGGAGVTMCSPEH